MRRAWVFFLLLIFALAEALATGSRLFYNLAYTIAGLLLVSFLLAWYNVNWLRLTRETLSNRTQVGRMAEERFVVENTGLLPKLWVEVRDHSNLPGHHASHVVSSLGPHKRRGWSVHTLCRRRGRYTLGPVSVISGDPFGLFRRERRLSLFLTSSIVVYPAVVDLPGFLLPVGSLPGGGSYRRRTHYITPNVRGVRDYYPGDSFNRIHWPSSARTGRLMVKEFELDPTADVWLFLDMQASVQAGYSSDEMGREEAELPYLIARSPLLISPSTEDYAVTLAASLAKHFLDRDRAVGLVAYGRRREVIQSDQGERQLTKIMETLAVIRPLGSIPMAEALAAEGSGLRRDVSVIVITGSTDVVWVKTLRNLGRSGIRGVAALIDAHSFGAEQRADGVLQALAVNGIPAYRVRRDQSLREALSAFVTEAGRSWS